MFFGLALLIFASLVLAGYALATMSRAREEAKQALGRRLWTMTGSVDGTLHRAGVLKDRRLSTIGALNTLLPRLGFVTPLVAMIGRAGLKKRVGEVVLYVLLAACAAILIVTMVTGNPALGVLAGAVGAAVPLVVVRRIASRRSARFAEQLPDALDLARAALQAGHGLMAALSVVADEFPDPIAQEFREITEEVRLGLPLRDALDNLSRRVDAPDISLLAIGILVTQDIGGNLAEVLDNISHTIRERFKLQRETKALTAQGRMSGILLTLLPILVATALSILNPGYISPMFEPGTGRYMLAYSACSLLAGHFVIRRLVRVKV
jgi:tight adherence protein B